MKHLNDYLNESVKLEDYISGLEDLISAAKDKKHALNTSRALKTYYENALKMGISHGLIDNLTRKRLNKRNREMGKLSADKSDREHIIDNLNFVIYTIKNNK